MITLTHAADVPQRVREAVAQANALLSGDELYDVITARQKTFDKSTPVGLLPSVVSTAFRNLTETFNVVMHRFRDEDTTGGYTCSRDATVRRRLRLSNRPNHVDNSLPVMVNTLIHESIHALDCFTSAFFIGHDRTGRANNLDTAPYWIGDAAGDIIRRGQGIASAPFTNEVEVISEDEFVKAVPVEE